MLSGILIFNQKGENLIFRAFRNDCRPRLADVFRIQVISNAQVRSPILTLGSTTFSHVKHENIYLVAITKSNANAALVFEFLYRLVGLGRGYFGKFDEEAVKNNFVLVYELLDGELWSTSRKNGSYRTIQLIGTTIRDSRLRLPPKYRNRHPKDVHNNRRRQVRTNNGRLLPNNNASHRCPLMAPLGHPIPQE